ncbi:hypothetical protein ABIB40_000590 [Pedobacter sp. UYP30]|uniref:hypothetical protein n=1 Tax=Pedobacter sp. UYP30 TaxID=1756400 RepID=UPI00339458F9
MKLSKHFKTPIFFWLILCPLFGFAQKAFEMIHYKGVVNGISVKCDLANGYIGATEITMLPRHKKPLIFIAASLSPDNHRAIKFLHYQNPLKADESYFILQGMKELYQEDPSKLFGVYKEKNKKYKVELTLVKAAQ